jgi:hypothetical protein
MIIEFSALQSNFLLLFTIVHYCTRALLLRMLGCVVTHITLRNVISISTITELNFSCKVTSDAYF